MKNFRPGKRVASRSYQSSKTTIYKLRSRKPGEINSNIRFGIESAIARTDGNLESQGGVEEIR